MKTRADLGQEALDIVCAECISPEGYFLASAPRAGESGTGIYDYFFARDSMIMSLFVLDYYRLTKDDSLLPAVKRSIEKCSDTQGMELNIYNGEIPGRIIHWIRPHDPNYKRNPDEKQWYCHPSGIMRIFMSADSTSLYLLALAIFWELVKDEEWVRTQEAHAASALRFLLEHGDTNNDGLQDYVFEGRPGGPAEHYGGHPYQGWKDSGNLYGGEILPYPHTLCEVQAYTYTAFLKWARYFAAAKRKYADQSFAETLIRAAERMKHSFNLRFPIQQDHDWYLPAILYGENGKTMHVESNMGHCLFAADILDDKHWESSCITRVDVIRNRLMRPDMFVSRAGIRTLSCQDPAFDQTKYHEGIIWPHDSAICALGLMNFGYLEDAKKIFEAILTGQEHFVNQGKSPGMELYGFNEQTGEYSEFRHPNGNLANDKQGWSLLATLLAATYLNR